MSGAGERRAEPLYQDVVPPQLSKQWRRWKAPLGQSVFVTPSLRQIVYLQCGFQALLQRGIPKDCGKQPLSSVLSFEGGHGTNSSVVLGLTVVPRACWGEVEPWPTWEEHCGAEQEGLGCRNLEMKKSHLY